MRPDAARQGSPTLKNPTRNDYGHWSGSSPTLRVGAIGNASAERPSSSETSGPMPLNAYGLVPRLRA